MPPSEPQTGSTPHLVLQLSWHPSWQPFLPLRQPQRWQLKIRSSKQGRQQRRFPQPLSQPQLGSTPQTGSSPQVGAFASQPQVGAFASQPHVGAFTSHPQVGAFREQQSDFTVQPFVPQPLPAPHFDSQHLFSHPQPLSPSIRSSNSKP
jgi:hypothetical protein